MSESVISGFESVVLDCDSTLVAIEGIDELAPGDPAIAELTRQAMDGARTLESVYGARLERIRPTREALDGLGERYIAALVPDAREVVTVLRELGKAVRIVSGGILAPVRAVAYHLGLPEEMIAAVEVFHDAEGAYLGFDEASPLVRSDGKTEVIEAWSLPRPTLLVGDGASDLAARSAVDLFAAFVGVERRAAVEAPADAVIEGPGLAGVLSLAVSREERSLLGDSEWQDLLRRGDRELRRR